MRLVDIDKFINDFPIRLNHYDEKNGSKKFVLGIELVLGSLECTPTVEAISIEQLLSILPKYDDYIHTKTYPYNETAEDIYSKGHEEGWNACLEAIKEELNYWEKENEKQTVE